MAMALFRRLLKAVTKRRLKEDVITVQPAAFNVRQTALGKKRPHASAATALPTQKRSVTTVIRPRNRVPMAKRAAAFAILCAELRSSMELIAEMVV